MSRAAMATLKTRFVSGLYSVHEVASYINLNITAILSLEIIFQADGLLVN